MEVEGFVNVTGANLHARRFGGPRGLYVILERILAHFLGKLSRAHVSSLSLAKPGWIEHELERQDPHPRQNQPPQYPHHQTKTTAPDGQVTRA